MPIGGGTVPVIILIELCPPIPPPWPPIPPPWPPMPRPIPPFMPPIAPPIPPPLPPMPPNCPDAPEAIRPGGRTTRSFFWVRFLMESVMRPSARPTASTESCPFRRPLRTLTVSGSASFDVLRDDFETSERSCFELSDGAFPSSATAIPPKRRARNPTCNGVEILRKRRRKLIMNHPFL